MVLESLVVPIEMEKHPRGMVFIGLAYSTLSIFLGLFVFEGYASLASVFLTTMPLIIVFYKAIDIEEQKDIVIHGEFSLMKEHRYILSFFIYLFIGMVVSYAFWFFILPSNITQTVFSTQIDTIESMTGSKLMPTGSAYSTGSGQSFGMFKLILLSNLRVLVFCILFSFLYGSGALFILTWNASIIGVAAGNIFRKIIVTYSATDQYTVIYNYFMAFPMSFSYLIHGIPEVAAYFLGALGGGIISVAVIKHDIRSSNFRHVLIDSVDLLLLSAIVLAIAAFIEIYITPLSF